MKGPANRRKFVIRRLWECPLCQQRRSTPGHIVNVWCDCRPAAEPHERVAMRLIEDVEHRRPVQP